MKTWLLAASAAALMTSVASAEPMRLNEAQMDQVSAGVLDSNLINIPIAVLPQISVPLTVNPAVAIGVLAENINAIAQAAVNSGNLGTIGQNGDLDLDDLGIGGLGGLGLQ